MKQIRQLVCLLLISCMSLSIVACGKEDTNDIQEETTEITTETLADEDAEIEGKIVVWVKSASLANTKYQEYKKEFEAQYPGTEVEYKIVPNFEIAGYNSIISGNAGDVVMIPEKMTKDEIKEYFIPFGSTEEIGQRYREQYIHRMDYDGVVYGIPEYIMPQGIAYNKRVLEYSGIVELPTTPDEFIDMLITIKKENKGIIPFYIKYDSLDDWQMHAWGSVAGDGDYHYNGMVMETNPFSKDSPNYIIHRLLYDIEYERLSQQNALRYVNAKGMLNRGQIACMLVDWNELSSLQNADTNPDDIGYMPFPYNIDGEQYATAKYGYCYGIPLTSENKTTAEAFVNYMIKKSGYATSEGAISLKKKASKPTLLNDFSGVTLVLDNPPTEDKAGKYETLCQKSGVMLEECAGKELVIETAKNARPFIRTSPNQDGDEEDSKETEKEDVTEEIPEDFDEIMELWYSQWKSAK